MRKQLKTSYRENATGKDCVDFNVAWWIILAYARRRVLSITGDLLRDR